MTNNQEKNRLAQQIKQANKPETIDQARQAYISLLEQDEWRVTTRALTDAMPLLRLTGIGFPMECALVSKVLEMLRGNHPLHAIGMGEPPGISGLAHIMKGGFLEGLYIKIKIEDDIVYVLSFHL